jgi:hypothetical protein
MVGAATLLDLTRSELAKAALLGRVGMNGEGLDSSQGEGIAARLQTAGLVALNVNVNVSIVAVALLQVSCGTGSQHQQLRAERRQDAAAGVSIHVCTCSTRLARGACHECPLQSTPLWILRWLDCTWETIQHRKDSGAMHCCCYCSPTPPADQETVPPAHAQHSSKPR